MKRLKRLNLHSVVSGSAVAFALRIAGVLLVFLQDAAMGRWLGAQGYGIFCFFRSLFTTIALMALLGLNISSVKFTAIYFNEKKQAHLRGFFLWSQASVFVMSALIMAIVFFYALFLGSGKQHEFLITLFAGTFLIPLVALSKLRQGFFRGLGRIAFALLPEEIVIPVLTLFLMWFFLSQSMLTASTCMLAFDVANIVALATTFIIMRTLLPHPQDNSRAYDWRLWLKVSMPMLLINITAQLLGQTEIFLLGKFRLMSEVGLFTVANRIAALANLPMNIVYLVLVPIIAKEFSLGAQLELKRVVRIGSAMCFWGAILVSLPLLVSPDFFLGLFGREFVVSKFTLIVLLLGKIVSAFYGPNGYLLIMTGHEVFFFKVALSSLIFDVCLGLILIPQGGIVGAAIASTATETLRNVILDFACRKKVGISPHAGVSLKEIRSLIGSMK